MGFLDDAMGKVKEAVGGGAMLPAGLAKRSRVLPPAEHGLLHGSLLSVRSGSAFDPDPGTADQIVMYFSILDPTWTHGLNKRKKAPPPPTGEEGAYRLN